jgi:hypothetical protein
MCTDCKQSDFAAKQPAIVEQVDRRKVRERTNVCMFRWLAAQVSVALLLRKALPRAGGFAHDAYFNHTDSTSRHHRHCIALHRTT